MKKKIYFKKFPGEDRIESARFKEIKKEVKKRDKCICGVCGKYRPRGEVHHIRKWSSNPRLRFDILNLVWLDYYCHNKILKGHEDDYIAILTEVVRKNTENYKE
jgi:queuine/archaeosine tRNA-ribosyltransferase